MKLIAISDIKISEQFLHNPPKPSNLNKTRNYYLKHGRIDKPIIINHKNLLLDGYKRYLILKENGVEYAECEVVKWIPKKRELNLR
jgi:ParB-like chromosome segregation protein Spo0J